MRPQVSKPSALVYLAGSIPGWTSNHVEGIAAAEQVVTLVKQVPYVNWQSSLQGEVANTQTPLFILVQDGPVTSADLQLAQQFPQRKFLFVGSQMQAGTVPQNAQVVVPNSTMTAYLLGWLAGASAANFQLGSQPSGALPGTAMGNNVSGALASANTTSGLASGSAGLANAVGNPLGGLTGQASGNLVPGGTTSVSPTGAGTGVFLGWAGGGIPQVTVGDIQSALVGGWVATPVVHPVPVQLASLQSLSVSPQTGAGAQRVIVVDRVVTPAEWAQVKAAGALLVSLCPQPVHGPGWMAGPVLPSPQTALQFLQQFGQSQSSWQGGVIHQSSQPTIAVNGAAVSQSLQTELAHLETDLQTHPVHFSVAWMTVPAAQRTAWQFLWVNAPTS